MNDDYDDFTNVIAQAATGLRLGSLSMSAWPDAKDEIAKYVEQLPGDHELRKLFDPGQHELLLVSYTALCVLLADSKSEAENGP